MAYIALGLLGAPIFALGGGPLYLLSPTFGYLLGFLAAAYACGRWKEPLYPYKLVKIILLANGLVYLLEYLWLTAYYALLGLGPYSLYLALAMGVAPFILWDAAKMGVAAAVIYEIRRLKSRRSRASSRAL